MLAFSATASAGIIFQDNFDAENGGVGQLNYTGFLNWTVDAGTVDLIGNGGVFDFLPGNGLYVDMDGSTSAAGLIAHVQALAPGNYTLSFDLAGNRRNGANETTTASVSIETGSVGVANQSYSLTQSAAFQTFSLDFSVGNLANPTNIEIAFGADGGDNIGMLLDNIVLADRVAVPEPSSLLLLGAGLLGIGAARRKVRLGRRAA